MKRSRKQILCAIFVFTIIAAAYGCRTLARLDIGGKECNFIRAGLYLLLFSAWGFSLDKRIIQKQVLHYLRMISALIIIWLSLRTVKYELVSDPTASRYLWYLYYLPMLFIPLFGVFIAMTLGKSENYRLTKKRVCLRLSRQCFSCLSLQTTCTNLCLPLAVLRVIRATALRINRFTMPALCG